MLRFHIRNRAANQFSRLDALFFMAACRFRIVFVGYRCAGTSVPVCVDEVFQRCKTAARRPRVCNGSHSDYVSGLHRRCCRLGRRRFAFRLGCALRSCRGTRTCRWENAGVICA
eukprot:g2993.t1